MLENRWFSQIVLAAGVMFVSVTASFAGMIVDSQGFEAPKYSSGALQGSNGWVQIGSGGTATVESAEKFSGSQAVQVNRAANSDTRWLVPVSGYPELPNKIIQISWDMKVSQNPSKAAGTYGPFFGVEAYDGPKGSPALLFGSLGVDAKTLDILYQVEGTGAFATVPGGKTVNTGWNHFSISLDFTSHQYSAYLNYNSTPLVTTGFVDGSLNSFTDADISALAAAGDSVSQAFTGTAYYDNFQVAYPFTWEALTSQSAWEALASQSWSGSNNWTDGYGKSAPGVAPRPIGTDTATFDGSGSQTQINLNGVNPNLKSLSFSTSSYKLSGSSLTMFDSSSGSTATVNVSSGTQTIGSELTLASTTQMTVTNSLSRLIITGNIVGAGALLKNGTGTLILSGSNSYTGGTNVLAGILAVTNSHALPDNHSLTIGAGGTLIFDPSFHASTPQGLSYEALPMTQAVPEPSTLALLGTATLGLLGYALRRHKPA